MPESKIKNATRAGNAWLELETICRKIHVQLYDTGDIAPAMRYRARLQKVLGELPKNDLAILREEGLALLHEMQGEITQAITHRRKEIRLIERLHKSVEQSITNGDYDATMGKSILAGRTAGILMQRRTILAALQQKRDSSKRIDVVNIVRPRAAANRRIG